MINIKCSKCKKKFKLPSGFKGVITCEDCDSLMNENAELLQALELILKNVEWEKNSPVKKHIKKLIKKHTK